MNGASILIVEDEAIVARDLQGRLTKLGYRPVDMTARGDQAVALAEQLRPDVVLMDIHLQGAMDGVEAAAEIRSRFGLPVIFATANADSTTLSRALLTDPFGYIVKPFEERALHTAIEMALYKSRNDRLLRASEANKAAILNAALDCIITTDVDGRITEFNPAAEQTFGHSRESVLGQTLPELLLPVAAREGYLCKVAQCLASSSMHGRGQRFELTALRSDGMEFPVELSLSANVTARGDRPVAIGFWRDLSQRKRLEQQVRQLQKMEAIGNLAGGIAHDFNNLLTIINGQAEALFGSLRADIRACQRVQEIARAGDTAARLTRQLLAFSRQQLLRPRVLNLNDLVCDFHRMLGRLIGEDITFTTNLSPELGEVRADPSQIEQVLMNLVANARDAMPTGGQLVIETSNVELDEGYALTHPDAKPGLYALLAVSDTGCGMDKQTMARIFEPFFTTKEIGKGTGLGLATVYGIVRQSDGYMYVYSEAGFGTTFKVYLPVTREKALVVRSKPSATPPAGNETVLLVEDDDGLRAFIRSTLEEYGYTVLEASHGKEALALARAFARPIDLLLSDVVMPEMGGRALAEQLAALRPEARLIFMSGYTNDIIMRHGIMEAEVEFIQKPYTIVALLTKIRDVLDQGRTLRHAAGPLSCSSGSYSAR